MTKPFSLAAYDSSKGNWPQVLNVKQAMDRRGCRCRRCGSADLCSQQVLAVEQAAKQQPVAAVATAAGPSALPILDKSIAVLPFTDMSEKKDEQYFADGMAEEIIDLLANIPGLTVIGRTPSFQFKDKGDDLRTIGTKLHAARAVADMRSIGRRCGM
jgi:hypothetical protein